MTEQKAMKFILTSIITISILLSTFKTNDTQVEFERKCTKCKDVGDVGHAI